MACEKVSCEFGPARMIKYANNILLATQISMMNEIANLSNEVGRIDVMQVVGGVTLDKRWSPEQDGKRVKRAF